MSIELKPRSTIRDEQEKSKDPPTAHENQVIEGQNVDEKGISRNISLCKDLNMEISKSEMAGSLKIDCTRTM